MHKGIFTISLDFELYWGVRDKRSIEEYGENIRGVSQAVPAVLDLFGRYNIHATWAVVGLLLFENTTSLKKHIKKCKISYEDENLSPYAYIEKVGNLSSCYHFAPELIKLILSRKGQEIGSHSFSHYYCLEEGQTVEEFDRDMFLAKSIAEKLGVNFSSFIFPRNQYSDMHLKILSKYSISCFRGNEKSWLHSSCKQDDLGVFQRMFRLLDSYVNVFGHHTYSLDACLQEDVYNIRSSRFLRPYLPSLSYFEKMKVNRILKSMTYAAKNNQVFHLWWHPHNFGINLENNLESLNVILAHYEKLQQKYGMMSLNMAEISSELKALRGVV